MDAKTSKSLKFDKTPSDLTASLSPELLGQKDEKKIEKLDISKLKRTESNTRLVTTRTNYNDDLPSEKRTEIIEGLRSLENTNEISFDFDFSNPNAQLPPNFIPKILWSSKYLLFLLLTHPSIPYGMILYSLPPLQLSPTSILLFSIFFVSALQGRSTFIWKAKFIVYSHLSIISVPRMSSFPFFGLSWSPYNLLSFLSGTSLLPWRAGKLWRKIVTYLLLFSGKKIWSWKGK